MQNSLILHQYQGKFINATRVSITKIVQLITSRENLRKINKKNLISRNPGEISKRKEKAENQKCPQWILRFSHRKL